VFDYYVDEASCSMQHWEARVSPFTYQPSNFSSMFVPTVETTRIHFLMDLLMSRNHYVMLVGNTGAAGCDHGYAAPSVALACSAFLSLRARAIPPHVVYMCIGSRSPLRSNLGWRTDSKDWGLSTAMPSIAIEPSGGDCYVTKLQR